MNTRPAPLIVLLLTLFLCAAVYAQTPEEIQPEDTLMVQDSVDWIPDVAPATNVIAEDNPDDAGGEIHISWDLSADDTEEANAVSKYLIMRSTNPNSGFIPVGVVNHRDNNFININTDDKIDYYYKVFTVPFPDTVVALSNQVIDSISSQHPIVGELGPDNVAMLYSYDSESILTAFRDDALPVSEVAGPVRSKEQWFNSRDLDTLVIGLIICLSVVVFITMARSGRQLFLRRIGGLQAIDEAIGRATEMGKSILFIPGIQDMDDVQTVAGITILGRIAKTIAEYDTKINMPVSRSIVMTTARETIKEAYLSAGRPDAYSDEMVYYLTDEQFGYVAAVDGIMVREKPATCFYLGAFFAESLIMAETGNSIGAIQIAGTAMPAQLPFFVAACDYTLIGEELFAASAYLSGEPKQLGSLKGQDVGKVIAMIFISLGTILFTVAAITGDPTALNWAETVRSWFVAG